MYFRSRGVAVLGMGVALAALFAIDTSYTGGAILQDKPATAPQKPLDSGGGSSTLPRVKLETTMGEIVLELDGEKAPVSVENFIKYVESGFYDNLVFHRIVPGFMIQGGGFTAALDQKDKGLRPPIKNEWKNGLKNVRGTIAMARTPEADSATAQFFINLVDNTPGHKYDLDTPKAGAAYAVFGSVVQGMEVVDRIAAVPLKDDPKLSMGPVVPVEPVVIKSAKLVGPYDREKVAGLVAAAGKPPAPAAWKAKYEEARKAYFAARQAAQGAGSDEGKKKEAEALTQKAKDLEQEVLRLAAEDAEKELAGYVAKQEKELGKTFEKTSSGMCYLILKEGSGQSPKPSDTAQVHYTLWLLNGSKVDSSLDRGQPSEFGPQRPVIKGWMEGVGMMKVGEKRKLIIPPALGYGLRSQQEIPANSVLVLEVELLAIK